MWMNRFTLPVSSFWARSDYWLQYRLIFSKSAKFYGVNICKINCFNYRVNIAYFMPRMHKKVPGTILHKRPTLRGTVFNAFNLLTVLCKLDTATKIVHICPVAIGRVYHRTYISRLFTSFVVWVCWVSYLAFLCSFIMLGLSYFLESF